MGIEDPLETESLLRPSTHPIAKSHNTTRARKKRGCDCSVSYRVILAWILSSAVTLLHAHRALEEAVACNGTEDDESKSIILPRRAMRERNGWALMPGQQAGDVFTARPYEHQRRGATRD